MLDTTLYKWGRAVFFGILSPWLEKNPLKTAAVDAPVTFSMSRIIVSLFSWGLYQQIVKAGIAGWPEATLCIALAFALPLLSALDKVKPSEVLNFGEHIIDRFGVGDVRKVGNLYKTDPETSANREDEVVGHG